MVVLADTLNFMRTLVVLSAVL